MSRIDEALRRLRGADLAVSVEPEPEPDISGEPFRSAWELHDRRAAETVRLAEPALVSSAPPSEPVQDAAGAIGSFSSQWKERLVISPHSNPFMVEQFRRLAATLHQAQVTNNIKSVMVTSATPGDGKTLTAINLALILSESYGRQVLLIDADLRRPSIKDVSHMPNIIGLADGLRMKKEQKLSVFRLTRNLSLLPAGRPDPDPMAGLTSERMRRIIGDACEHFDWVVVDAPPVGAVADGSILSDMVDGTLLVVRAGYTACALTKKAIDAVGRERIFGIVLNGLQEIGAERYGYASYYTGTVKGEALEQS